MSFRYAHSMEKKCFCQSGLLYMECCGKYLENKQEAEDALALMRSRYSAYVLKDGQYLYDTCSRRLQDREDIQAVNEQQIEWIGLTIESSSEDEVTFRAYYSENGEMSVMREHSYFIVEDGRLRYDRGEMLKAEISRNEACPCGSGKKFKRCCAKGSE